MVRRNLMLSVLDKQRRLLDSIVDQLANVSEDELSHYRVFTQQTEQIALNLSRWVTLQRLYDHDETNRNVLSAEDFVSPFNRDI